jgi:hypothetical protein
MVFMVKFGAGGFGDGKKLQATAGAYHGRLFGVIQILCGGGGRASPEVARYGFARDALDYANSP